MIGGNADFIAAHRRRQVARDVTQGSFTSLPEEPQQATRVDVGQSVIAGICGITERRLAAFWPKEWRWSRDYRELGGIVFFNRAALVLLVGELATRGEPTAAAKLLGYLTPDEKGMLPNGLTVLALQPKELWVDAPKPPANAAPARPWYRDETGGMS